MRRVTLLVSIIQGTLLNLYWRVARAHRRCFMRTQSLCLAPPPAALSGPCLPSPTFQPPASQNGDQPPSFPPGVGSLQKPRPLSLSLGESGPGARATSPDRAWHARDDAGPCMRAHTVAGARARGRDRAARARRASSRSLAADGGGRWEGPARREARGPAREPPGAGKTRLLLPLPLSPLSLALSAHSFLSPRPLFTLSLASSSSPSAGLCGPCLRTPLSSASRTLLLHPRSPFLLGEDSWGAPSPLHPPLFSTRFLPGPPTAPSQCPSSRRGPYPTSVPSAPRPCIRRPLC